MEQDIAGAALDFKLLLLVQGWSLLHVAVNQPVPVILGWRLSRKEQVLNIPGYKALAEHEVSIDELSRVAESCSDHKEPQHSPSAASAMCPSLKYAAVIRDATQTTATLCTY